MCKQLQIRLSMCEYVTAIAFLIAYSFKASTCMFSDLDNSQGKQWPGVWVFPYLISGALLATPDLVPKVWRARQFLNQHFSFKWPPEVAAERQTQLGIGFVFKTEP